MFGQRIDACEAGLATYQGFEMLGELRKSGEITIPRDIKVS
jgi:hypothetical protein